MMNKPLHPRRFARPTGRTASALALGGVASLALAATISLRAVAQPPAATTPPASSSSGDWPALRGDVTRRGVSNEKLTLPLTLLWRYSAGALRGNQSAPVIMGDTVYYSAIGSGEGGVLYALDTKTGARKWQYPVDPNGLPNRGVFLTAPLVSNNRLYVGSSDGNMYVLNAQTGQLLFPIRTGRAINSAPAIEDGVLYFGSNDGNLYAVDPTTGESAWKQFYQSGNAINSAPVIANGMVFFTATDNAVYALREKTGIFRWRLRIPERMQANAPIFADNVLYVPAGQRLYALQGTSGLSRWVRDLRNDVLTAPVADGGIVYAISRATGSGSLLYAIRSANGRDAWPKPVALPLAPSAAPTIAGNVMYIPTSRNVLLAVSTTDGKILWQYYTEAPSRTVATGGNSGGSFGGSSGSSGSSGSGSGSGSGGGNFGGGGNTTTTVAGRSTVSLLAPPAIAGGTIYTLGDDGSLSAFRNDAPDAVGPDLTYQYPQPGQAISGQPPVTLAANLVDMGTGLDPNSLVLKLDGSDVNATFDASRNLLIYTTKSTGKQIDPPLENGRHTVSVTASDWRGNKTEQSWSFVVNNALQPIRNAAPQAPRATGTSTQPQAPGAQGGQNGRPGRGGRGGRGNNGPGNNGPGNNGGGAPPPPTPPQR